MISQLQSPEVGAPLARLASCGVNVAGSGALTAPAGPAAPLPVEDFNGLAMTLSGSALTTSYSVRAFA